MALVFFSFLLGLIFTLIPLPPGFSEFRPDWVALLVLYWSLNTPKRFGVISAWGIGIIVDVLSNSLLGAHALGYIVLSYLALSISQQYPLYSIIQQLLIVLFSISVYLALSAWITGMTQPSVELSLLFLPLLSSLFIWPWLSALLNLLRRKSEH